jgi:multisubunit Na+/H+ antiporter MnhC subunit
MKIFLKILFIVFLVWMCVGFYLLENNHEKAKIVMGLCVFYLSFVLMPIFIYYRYRNGRYQKYIISDDKLRNAFKQQGKD